MSVYNKPDPLVLSGSQVRENWKVFKRAFERYLVAADLQTEDDERKVALFMNFAGAEAETLLENSTLTEAQQSSYDAIVGLFENYCNPKTDILLVRFQFFSRSQNEDEPFDAFLTAIKKLAKYCNFETQESSLIRDRIVIGVRSNELRENLLRTRDLTEDKAIEICRIYELSRSQASAIGNDLQNESVNAIKSRSKPFRSSNKISTSNNRDDSYESKKSDHQHKPKSCAASGKTRNKSGGGGCTKAVNLSPELAALVGEEAMARHEVVKKVWSIIKERNLCDPKNMQFAICDDELLKVFGVKRFRTFGMMKYLKDHFVD